MIGCKLDLPVLENSSSHHFVVTILKSEAPLKERHYDEQFFKEMDGCLGLWNYSKVSKQFAVGTLSLKDIRNKKEI
jgi:hypothetical protein